MRSWRSFGVFPWTLVEDTGVQGRVRVLGFGLGVEGRRSARVEDPCTSSAW